MYPIWSLIIYFRNVRSDRGVFTSRNGRGGARGGGRGGGRGRGGIERDQISQTGNSSSSAVAAEGSTVVDSTTKSLNESSSLTSSSSSPATSIPPQSVAPARNTKMSYLDIARGPQKSAVSLPAKIVDVMEPQPVNNHVEKAERELPVVSVSTEATVSSTSTVAADSVPSWDDIVRTFHLFSFPI